jgi:formylglycine-generating enzyme required for sulfatase activity
VYSDYWDGSGWVSYGISDEAAVKSLGSGSANSLGLYDMSGNVLEWCFTEYSSSPSNRINRGGCWRWNALNMIVSIFTFSPPDYEYTDLGFRLCRTGD